ncbi:hypothetical protein N2152v2_008271 [Parachlorella kessleri]
MPFLGDLEVPQVPTSPRGNLGGKATRARLAESAPSNGSHEGEQAALEQQALAWARHKLRAAHGLENVQPEPQPAGVKPTKKRKLAEENGDAAHDTPTAPSSAAGTAAAAAAAAVAVNSGMRIDVAALLAAADAEAAAAAAMPLPVPVRALPLQLTSAKEVLEPSPCYKGVWRVVAGPRQGLFKAQISTPGRAGRPKRLDYFNSDIEAAECYDRAALEKFGIEQADLNFPATSYGYLVPGRHGLLQPKPQSAASRRPRSAAPLIPRQQVPEYLDAPLDPASKSAFIGVRLAKNCRGWVAKIKMRAAAQAPLPLHRGPESKAGGVGQAGGRARGGQAGWLLWGVCVVGGSLSSHGWAEEGGGGSGRRPEGRLPLAADDAQYPLIRCCSMRCTQTSCDGPVHAGRHTAPLQLDSVGLCNICREHKGEKHLIGTYRSEEEAARAWDRTALHLRGPNTQTNFPIEQYLGDEALAESYSQGGAEPSRRVVRRQKQPPGAAAAAGSGTLPDGLAAQQAGLPGADAAAQQQWLNSLGLQGALFDPATLQQHTDWLAAAAAVANFTAGQQGAAALPSPLGTLQLAGARPPSAAGEAGAAAHAAAEAGGEAAAADATGNGASGSGSETDEEALRQQQQDQQQQAAAAAAVAAQQQQQLLLLGVGDPNAAAAALRWGDPTAIEGQLHQLQGVEQTLLAAGGQTDLARLLAAAGIGFAMPPASAGAVLVPGSAVEAAASVAQEPSPAAQAHAEAQQQQQEQQHQHGQELQQHGAAGAEVSPAGDPQQPSLT